MHIEKEMLEAFWKNELESDEYLRLLEHMGACDYCAEEFASLEENNIKAPKYLKDQIINRTQMPDVRAAVTIKKTSKNLQFLLYSLKTATAVAGALLILFAVTKMEDARTFEKVNITGEFAGRLSERSDKAADFINELSNQIMNGGMKR